MPPIGFDSAYFYPVKISFTTCGIQSLRVRQGSAQPIDANFFESDLDKVFPIVSTVSVVRFWVHGFVQQILAVGTIARDTLKDHCFIQEARSAETDAVLGVVLIRITDKLFPSGDIALDISPEIPKDKCAAANSRRDDDRIEGLHDFLP